jgi:hypothetical protein
MQGRSVARRGAFLENTVQVSVSQTIQEAAKAQGGSADRDQKLAEASTVVKGPEVIGIGGYVQTLWTVQQESDQKAITLSAPTCSHLPGIQKQGILERAKERRM